MLDFLSQQLARSRSIDEKIALLDSLPSVREGEKRFAFLSGLPLEEALALKGVMAIGQADRLFAGVDASRIDQIRALLEKLVAIDHFYREIGGIVGYQAKILELLRDKVEKTEEAIYHAPSFLDLKEESEGVKEAVSWGVEAMAEMAEIYPLGGAADRLHLVDEKTGSELPAAKLPFAGRSLLAHLIRDLEAREHLYFERTGRRLVTPIAIMTSHEKNNHAHVLEVCEKAEWFGRPKESIRFFTQPLVPAVKANGDWCLAGPLKPVLKPGGHGVIWKLARDQGILAWLAELGRTKALVRQINNPIAGLDYGLLAFTGIGWKKGMTFGFASCPRLLQAAEGVNVLIERNRDIVLTNVEYCDFGRFGIEDKPLKEGEPYSQYSSNTNILFADLQAIAKAIDTCPFPGLLINLKPGSYLTESGEKREEPMARLESTMQNIADVFIEPKKSSLQTEKTFVTYNHRHKTISTAKKAYVPGRSLQETPENCFYDLLQAHRELLLRCGFLLPPARSLEEYMQKGPEFLFLYHPGLGPLYSLIQEKMKGGRLALSAELIAEITDFQTERLCVEGSLQIVAEQGRCILENVTVKNRGVVWEKSSPFWKMDLYREETVKIILKGRSQFIARNVVLSGNQVIVVEDGQTVEM